MKLRTVFKISQRSIVQMLGVLAFIAILVWLFVTRGPLAPVGVEHAQVVRMNIEPSLFGIGTVEARLAYAVGPTQPGRVLRVLVDQGDAVKAGQLLAEMDPVDLDKRTEAAANALARARKTLQAVRAQLSETESREKLARANLARYVELQQKNFVAKEMLESRRHEANAAAAAVAAARANVEGAVSEVGRAEADLQGVTQVRGSYRLLSPVAGVVTAREVEPGTTVVAGQAVVRLVNPASLWVRARIDQSRAAGIGLNQPAGIVLRSEPDTAMPGRVARIELQSDSVTEERVVDVAFDAAPARLYLGELAEVTIRLPAVRDALAVPNAAVTQMEGRTGVWQAVDGRARFKPVRVGLQGEDGLIQVLAGLDSGERVIAYSTKQLADGMRVREQDRLPR